MFKTNEETTTVASWGVKFTLIGTLAFGKIVPFKIYCLKKKGGIPPYILILNTHLYLV